MIVRWRCDVAMADKKGISKSCDGKCHQCLCGIGMNEWGNEKHHSDMPEGCWNFTVRNLVFASGKDRTGKRGRPISSGGKQL